MDPLRGYNNHNNPPPTRDRIHNPNYPHEARPSPPPPYPTFQQPAPRQPTFDPFHRPGHRVDPFIPSFSKQRDLQQPGRVPDYPSSQHPSSPFHSRTSSSYLDERPSSIGASFRDGTLLRASYGPSCSGLTSSATGSSHGPLAQPKPPLFGRTMALPSSSPKHEHQASAIRAPDHPEMPRRPYGDSGDGPRFPRSNASMSINSLVDSGSNPTHRPPAWSPIPEKGSQAGTPSRTRHSSPGSPSAHAYRHDGNGLSYTPRAHSNLDLSRSHDTTGFSARSRLASQTQGGDKPGKNAHDFSRLLQPFHPPSLSALGPQPPRPSSQPAGIDQDYREQTIPASRAEYYDDPSIVAYGGSSRGRAPDDFSGMRRPVHDENFRRDPVEVPYEALAEGSIVGPLPAVDIGAGEDRGPFPSQYLVPPTTTQDLRRDGYYSGDSPIEARHAYTGAFTNQQEIGDVPSSLFANPIGRFGVSPQIERKIQRTPPAVDTGLRQSIEDHRAQHRSFPGLVNNDHGRRYERGSPLPQAVQGAQSQPVGSGRDPGIKSEFGKMFSGLGSGVGSTPQPVPPSHNGTSTPGPRSPLDEVRHSEVLNRRESNQNATGGRGGRKGRRTGALDGRTGTDGTDAKLTSAALSKVPKRNRYIQPPVPHHHHHPVAFHHHHHHHRRPEDEESMLARGSNRHNTGFRFPTPTVPYHHHHHHHHNHLQHHHHHAPKPKLSPSPVLKVHTSPLLQSIAHRARQHLGSQLYSPMPIMPPTASTTIESSHTNDAAPNLLPRFGRHQANSTFTIRVSRRYLTDAHRENICASRYIWGTDVYTDDSDPVAASIHSGWIRGAWASGIDGDLILGLDVVGNNEMQFLDSHRSLVAPPKMNEGGPIDPPHDRDLHLTILILPPLEKYSSKIWHGLKSREWGGNHDGMSFKIERLEWIDDETSERGPVAAKRKIAEGLRQVKRMRTDGPATPRTSSMALSGRGVAGLVQAAA